GGDSHEPQFQIATPERIAGIEGNIDERLRSPWSARLHVFFRLPWLNPAFSAVSHRSGWLNPVNPIKKVKARRGREIHSKGASERTCDGVTRSRNGSRYGVIKASEKHAVTAAARTSRSSRSFGWR